MTAHTPWTLESVKILLDSGDVDAIAEFFLEAIHCLNSHAALVEALKALFNETENYIQLNHLGALHNYSLQMARKALALAEPQP